MINADQSKASREVADVMENALNIQGSTFARIQLEDRSHLLGVILGKRSECKWPPASRHGLAARQRDPRDLPRLQIAPARELQKRGAGSIRSMPELVSRKCDSDWL